MRKKGMSGGGGLKKHKRIKTLVGQYEFWNTKDDFKDRLDVLRVGSMEN